MADSLDDLYSLAPPGGRPAPLHPGTINGALLPPPGSEVAPGPVDDLYARRQANPARPAMGTTWQWTPVDDPTAQRVRGAAVEAWNANSASPITPEWQARMNAAPEPAGWINRNIVNPAFTGVGYGAGALAAGAAGASATIGELANAAGVPALGRDINLGAQAAPVVAAEIAPLMPKVLTPKVEPPGQAFVRGLNEPPPASLPPGPTERVPGVEPKMAPPPGYVPPGVTPVTNSAAAYDVADAFYKVADKSGGQLNPNFVNKWADSVAGVPQQTAEGRIVAGETTPATMAARIQQLRDKPLSLAAVQEIDGALGDAIDKEYGSNGLSGDGRKLLQMQQSLRDQIAGAGAGDVTDPAGFDALSQGRQAWSYAIRMRDLERIEQKALLTDNPASSIRSGVRNYIFSDRARGMLPDEMAALTNAAKTGTLGEVTRALSSRLVPIAGYAMGGPIGGIATAGLEAVIAKQFRDALTSGQIGKLRSALGVLGQGVPQPGAVPGPRLQPRFAPIAAPPPPALLGTAVAETQQQQ